MKISKVWVTLLCALFTIFYYMPINASANIIWMPAGQLAQGATLKATEGKTIELVSIKKKIGTQPMYNLTINQNHDFFVGNHGGVLVHNCKKYTCPTCGYRTNHPTNFKTHLRRHTGERPFKCTGFDCDKSFSRTINLARHRENMHGVISEKGSVLYTCRYVGCNQKFSSKIYMTEHENTIHLKKLDNYVCPTCNKSFSYSRNGRRHVKNHHSPEQLGRLPATPAVLDEALDVVAEMDAGQPGPRTSMTFAEPPPLTPTPEPILPSNPMPYDNYGFME